VGGDVSRHADVARAVAACAEHAGQVNIMVAHAGIADVHPLLDVTHEQWQRVFDVARVVGFLVGRDSAYITGQTIVLDGGQTLGIPLEGVVN
jgi:NAD(P)-dependent dehydrogenase (short-subunit alcohol dehydrogenase family)